MEVKLQNKHKTEEMIDSEKIATLVNSIKDKSKLTAVFLPSNFEGNIPKNTDNIQFIPTTKGSLLNLINEKAPQYHTRIRYASDETGANKFLQSLIIAQATGNLTKISNDMKNMLIAYANDKDLEYNKISIQDIENYSEYLQTKEIDLSGLSGADKVVTILSDFENQHHAILSRKNKKSENKTS